MESSETDLLPSTEEKSDTPSGQLSSIAKLTAIQLAISKADNSELIRLANSSGGLLNAQLRKEAWPLLLNVDRPSVGEKYEQKKSWKDLPVHEDEEQVQKDVDRAFIYYPTGLSAPSIDAKKKRLSSLITRVLRTYPMLCYFQGYHDIAAVLLLVLDEEAAYSALVYLSLFRIRDYMLPTIKPAEKHLMLIPTILRLADPSLAQHIARIPVFYALAGTLTLYAHDVPNFEDITRLYDFLLAHEPVMAIYLFASIVIERREQLLSISDDDPDMIHYTLTKLPQQLKLEVLIASALQLFQDYPPESLPGYAWSSIPQSSVLKTSRNIFRKQTVSEAERAIQDQKRRLAWDEARRTMSKYVVRNRRALVATSTAVLVAALSVWLRRNGHDATLFSTIVQLSKTAWPS